MKKPPTAVLASVKDFDIEFGTKVVVRQTDTRSKLYQECRLTRKSADTVAATLREFGGSRFKVAVSISARTVSVLQPDLSWLGYADDFPVYVAAKIMKMISAKGSTKTLRLYRRTEMVS